MRSARIETSIQKTLEPEVLQVENESHSHSVPKNSETHFKVLVVSQKFLSVSRVQRQRMVNDLLKEEFQSGLHALTMRLYTPEEWAQSDEGKSFQSPHCHGGSKNK